LAPYVAIARFQNQAGSATSMKILGIHDNSTMTMKFKYPNQRIFMMIETMLLSKYSDNRKANEIEIKQANKYDYLSI
jgi:ribosome biogenesis protein Tsr3